MAMIADRGSLPRDRSPSAVQPVARWRPASSHLPPTALVPPPARDDAPSWQACRPQKDGASGAILQQARRALVVAPPFLQLRPRRVSLEWAQARTGPNTTSALPPIDSASRPRRWQD